MEVRKKNVYNPEAKYEWAPEAEFVLNGREFEAIVQSLAIANSIVQNALVLGVQEGIITEQLEAEMKKPKKHKPDSIEDDK
jgi:hypothetical protein